jgi:predicted O-methyltransferase YrrM
VRLLGRAFGRAGNTARHDALTALSAVYEHRPDLQEVFPEVQAGDDARLIDWAAHVTAGHWEDEAEASLAPHASWYAANFTGAPVPAQTVGWEAAAAACARAANPLAATMRAMRLPPGDIAEHLVTLSLLVTEFRLRTIVELGVRTGVSTLALLEAASRIDGRVFSVDVEPCGGASAEVKAAGLDARWTFVRASDLDLDDTAIPQPIDLLFIDTTHLYAHTDAEFKKYLPLLSDTAWIAVHDYVSATGVGRAVHELVEDLSGGARFYPFFHQHGLAVIRLTASTSS